ncbi:MAG TPA: hypothetical protein VJ547_12515 [Candidatus Thermoplasmatota archaeon]|nr:hypothetical protein [Candidatus Thermoplasmatota archaeon]
MAYAIVRPAIFEKDLISHTGGNAILRERVERRIAKLGDNPEHHGYHAGGKIRCNWVAGVGDFAIIYELHERSQTVRLLRFVSLENL